jgi:site-specific DNA recombinase
MTWASYARVSDPRQQTALGLDRYGLERQDRANETYIRSSGYKQDILKFRDRISGTTETRAEFERLLESVRSGQVAHVCIPEVDRLARDEFVAAALIFELWSAGATVHDALRNRIIDRKNAQNRREFFQDAIEASAEREKIVRRMYAGKLEKVRDGKPERPINAFGWRSGTVDIQEAELVRWMYRRALEVGTFRVSEELNAQGIRTRRGLAWQNSSVRLILTNPIYKGVYQYGRKGERLSLEVTAIVEPDLWNRTQTALGNRHKGQRLPLSRLEDYPLTGRIRCAECGGAMSPFQPSQKQHKYYFCRNTLVRTNKRCSHTRYYRADDLHSLVRAQMLEMHQDLGKLEAAIAAPPAVDTTIERQRLTKRLDRARMAYESGVDTLEEYASTKREVQALLSHLEAQTTPPPRDAKTAATELAQAVALPTLAEAARACNLFVRVRSDETVMLELV